ncbi:MAG TPA: hypothetical protein DEP65_09770, partial [Ruminococcus sp.]|nr:hypothetical protein [Ruminococcus sp.]
VNDIIHLRIGQTVSVHSKAFGKGIGITGLSCGRGSHSWEKFVFGKLLLPNKIFKIQAKRIFGFWENLTQNDINAGYIKGSQNR